MAFDHGELNVPLRKRGVEATIDEGLRQVARIQREKAAAARERARVFAEEKADALGLIERMTDEHVARLATKSGMQKRSVRKWLRSQAGLVPALVVKALREGGAT